MNLLITKGKKEGGENGDASAVPVKKEAKNGCVRERILHGRLIFRGGCGRKGGARGKKQKDKGEEEDSDEGKIGGAGRPRDLLV